MFFWKTSEGGGGHFRSKKLHCRFCWFQSGIFWVKKRNVISKKGRGGGIKAVWEFSKKTSILENPVTPNGHDHYHDHELKTGTGVTPFPQGFQKGYITRDPVVPWGRERA